MLIATRQKHQLSPLQLKLTLEKTDIEQVHEHRVLGVTKDAEMKWQSHPSNVCKIVSKSLFLLSQLKYYVNVKARKLVYSAHILSYTNYASTLWDVCSEVHLKKTTTHNLNSLHRRATKLILSDPSIPTDNKLKSIKLLPLTKQLKYNKAVVMFKVYNGKTPEYIRSLFTRSSSRYGSNNFIPPRTRIDLYKTSVAFSGSSVWNSLPLFLKNLRTIRCFKRHLHRHLSKFSTVPTVYYPP